MSSVWPEDKKCLLPSSSSILKKDVPNPPPPPAVHVVFLPSAHREEETSWRHFPRPSCLSDLLLVLYRQVNV